MSSDDGHVIGRQVRDAETPGLSQPALNIISDIGGKNPSAKNMKSSQIKSGFLI